MNELETINTNVKEVLRKYFMQMCEKRLTRMETISEMLSK